MAVFIELTTDPFVENFQRLKRRNDPAVARRGRAGLTNVRRPLRGLEVKEDTYACLKVLRADGSEVRFMDSSDASGTSTSYSNFILQSVQEQRMEKHQIIETFGDSYIYFFGEAPQFLDVQAVLVNSNDFNWEAEWWENWNTVLRGSKSCENGARTYLFYDDNVVEGYMLLSSAQKLSTEPFQVAMSFRMFVSSIRNVSSVGDPNFPVQESIAIPPDLTLGSSDSAQNLVDYLNSNGLATGDVRNSTSVLRSLIADNTDEYTGYSDAYPVVGDYLPEVDDPTVREQLEVENLFQEAINWMSCFGADINSYSSLSSLGMGINFSAGGGVGMGFGVSSGGATFGAVNQAGAGFGGSVGAGFGFGANSRSGFSSGIFAGPGTFGAGANAGVSANGSGLSGTGNAIYAAGQLSAQQDVLFSAGVNSRVSASSLQTGFGDPTYGYASPYGGPGYGQAGFGDNGGLSFGSSFGRTGDPGYLPPTAFSQAGVEDDRSDLERLLTPKPGYGAGLGGISADASYAGSGAGSAVSVGGSISAFAICAVPGTLNPNGTALSVTGRRLGFTTENPYGVPCLGGSGQSGINLLDML